MHKCTKSFLLLSEIFPSSPSLHGFHHRPIMGGILFTQDISRPSGMYSIKISYNESVKVAIAQFELDGRSTARSGRSTQQKERDAKDFLFILSVVKKAIDALIVEYGVRTIIFHGSLSEPKRIRLYNRYAKRIARQYRGHVTETPLVDFMEYRIILP